MPSKKQVRQRARRIDWVPLIVIGGCLIVLLVMFKWYLG